MAAPPQTSTLQRCQLLGEQELWPKCQEQVSTKPVPRSAPTQCLEFLQDPCGEPGFITIGVLMQESLQQPQPELGDSSALMLCPSVKL